jgi:DNA-binding MarR family transcriptional regulator
MNKPLSGKPLPPAAGGSDAPYQRIPAYLIRRLQMISTAIITEAFEGEDMSLSEWAVLTIIEHHPDVDQSRLADIVSIDRVNTGRLVDQLESKGLVERLSDEMDRRVWKLRCTRAGLQTRKRLLPCALASQGKLLACLKPQDRKSFIELMLRIVAANEKYIRPGAGRRKRKVQTAENG